MYEDDRDFPETALSTERAPEPELREHDWVNGANTVEVTMNELRQALAVLAVLEMDEDIEETGEALWVH